MENSSVGDSHRTVAAAAFEASVLVRSTGVCGGGRTRTSGAARVLTGAVAEFSRLEAAQRLVDLLVAAGRSASMQTYTAGNRHRYEIYRVLTADGTDKALQVAWRLGFTDMCGRPERRPTPPQLHHLRQLSSAAWRAALLVSGPGQSNSPGLRVTDLETATALVRAARLLEVPVRMSTRPGGQLLLVLPPGPSRQRLEDLIAEDYRPAEPRALTQPLAQPLATTVVRHREPVPMQAIAA